MVQTKRKAFTLIELLVSISLITLLSSLTVANYNKIRTSVFLDKDFEGVVEVIREAQSSSLAPFKGISAGIGMGEQLCGIGVHFVDSSSIVTTYYVAAVDCLLVGNYSYNSTNVLKQYNLEKSYIDINGSSKDLFFETPFAKAYIYPPVWANNNIAVTSSVDNSMVKNLQVNEGGLLIRD
jgi:prepilin-type N-terminal cleavage/methylation domain-containing protein